MTRPLVRLRALFTRARLESDLDEELRYHVDREIERQVANGMSRADAHVAARRAFGNASYI
ncbi:MAG TPA: permease prefix domain 1-containing protein, partial [Gemmatimonadaceae bacterium]|nr:permease prefix domain 1-containing protein [Gemmatimonadaceae bacterium]